MVAGEILDHSLWSVAVLKRKHKPTSPPGRFVTLLNFSGGGVLAEATASRSGVQCALHELGEGGSSDAPLAELASTVVSALRSHRVRSREFLLAIPRSQAVIKPLQLPPNTAEDEIAAMVQFQLQGEIPFPPEETVLDFAVLRRDSEGVGVLAAAVQTSTIEQHVALAQQAGLVCNRLTLFPSAIQHGLCSRETCEDKTIAMVTRLPGEMEIDVISRGAIQFSRSVTATDSPEALSKELLRSLRGYAAQNPNDELSEIVLVGEGVAAMAEAAGEAFSCPVRVEGETLDDAMELLCCGLSAEAGAKPMEAFNFLHPKKPVIKRDPKKIQATQLVAAVVLFLFGGIWTSEQYLNGLEQKRDDLLADYSTVRKDEKLALRLKKQVTAVKNWKSEEVDFLGHWANLSALLPPAADAYISSSLPGKRTSKGMSFTIMLRKKVDDAKEIVDALQAGGYQPMVDKGSYDPRNQFGYPQKKEILLDLKRGPVKQVITKGNLARPVDDDPTRSMLKRSSSRYSRGGGR